MKGDGKWCYLTVPVSKHSLSTPICDVRVSAPYDWRMKLQSALDFYSGKAPYYPNVKQLFHEILGSSSLLIAEFNIHAVKLICEYLDIPASFQVFSKMHLEMQPVCAPKDWALNIAVAMGADEYLNLPGGVSLYDGAEFSRAGVKLTFLELPDMQYSCGQEKQISFLSILDVMMWVSSDDIFNYLKSRGTRHIDHKQVEPQI